MANHETFKTINKSKLFNGQGVSYLDFRSTLTPHYAIAWFHIFLGYLSLVLVLAFNVFLQQTYRSLFWLAIPLCGLFVGYIVSSIHLFMHEASHYHLATGKKENDLLANIFIGLLVGMETNFYRSVHFVHHRMIGTKNDTEKSYFNRLSTRFFFESLTGIRLLKVMAHRNKNLTVNYGKAKGADIIKSNNRMFFTAALLNLSLIIVFFLFGYWQVSLVWIFGMGLGFPFFATFRQVLEHRSITSGTTSDEDNADPTAVHRMFGDGPIASTLGCAGFNRHLLHHWDPLVSYTRLKDVEDFLMDTPLKKELVASQTSYFKTFILLFNK